MKKIISEFLKKGLMACGFGPIVLAILYLILKNQNVIDTLSVDEVCLGIFSLSALAFIAGGMNVIYKIEKLPLMLAIFIHGLVLYISYLVTYIINNWIEWSKIPLLVFTLIFVLGYIIIWIVIYIIIKNKTEKLNQVLINYKK